jgi:hypothetical protein
LHVFLVGAPFSARIFFLACGSITLQTHILKTIPEPYQDRYRNTHPQTGTVAGVAKHLDIYIYIYIYTYIYIYIYINIMYISIQYIGESVRSFLKLPGLKLHLGGSVPRQSASVPRFGAPSTPLGPHLSAPSRTPSAT